MISYLNPTPYLPTPFGPHKVGTSEWEIPISEIPSSSQVPDSTISTIKFRLYYPTVQSAPATTIKWLPLPQNQWVEAYSSFLGAGSRLASFIAALPSLIKYTTIPATPNSPLLPRTTSSKYPVVVFSHGLGGNFNTYSSVCTSLASFGIVCAAPEHRDGSAPISFIRSPSGDQKLSVPYQKHSHAPSAEVLNARNAQLRVRLWEVEQLSTVLKGLDTGKTFINYAVAKDQSESIPSLKDTLDLRPGHITWAGHSFGAATMVQFVKSVYYHQHLPTLKGTVYENDADWRPLYTPAKDGDLTTQITADSPVALLDLWTMPLRGEATQWLWEKPLPCYDRQKKSSSDTTNVVAIMSAEFHRWTDLLNRTKAALSHNPAVAIAELERRKSSSTSSPSNAMSTPPGKGPSNTPLPFPDEENTPSSSASNSTDPSRSSTPSPTSSSAASVSSSSSSIIPPQSINPTPSSASSQTSPGLYLIPHSAHLSQSDFGVLFPNLTRYLMKAQDPQKTLELNVRAILAVMRARGLDVEEFNDPKTQSRDSILSQEGVEDRFVKLSLD